MTLSARDSPEISGRELGGGSSPNPFDDAIDLKLELDGSYAFRKYDQTATLISEFDNRSPNIFQPGDGKVWIDALVFSFVGHGLTSPQTPTRIETLDGLDAFPGNSGEKSTQDLVAGEQVARTNHSLFFIRFTRNSHSRLSASRSLFDKLVTKYDVTPRFREFVMSFGFKTKEFDFAPPTLRYRDIDAPVSMPNGAGDAKDSQNREYQRYECVYGFRYAANNGKTSPGEDPWSIRQIAIYQSYHHLQKATVWIIIGASKEMESCMRDFFEADADSDIFYPFALHAMLMENSLGNWRWYITYLTERVQELSDRVITSGRSDVASITVTFEDRQKLKVLEDKTLNLRTMLQSTIRTMESLKKRHSILRKSFGYSSRDRRATSNVLSEAIEQASLYAIKIDVLNDRVKGAASLLSDLLAYENASSLRALAEEARIDNSRMVTLTEKAIEDSRSIKIITIVTLIFLPSTVVASFFSTQFVQIHGDKFRLSRSTWVYFAVTIPLTMLTIAAWAWLPTLIPMIPRLLNGKGANFYPRLHRNQRRAEKESDQHPDPSDLERRLSLELWPKLNQVA